jgi:hypothetical protein
VAYEVRAISSHSAGKAGATLSASATRESGDQVPVARNERVWGVRSLA